MVFNMLARGKHPGSAYALPMPRHSLHPFGYSGDALYGPLSFGLACSGCVAHASFAAFVLLVVALVRAGVRACGGVYGGGVGRIQRVARESR